MTTILFSHPDAQRHQTPPGHPEQIARHAAVMAALADADVERRDAPLADDADILRCHPLHYLDGIRAAIPAQGLRQIDADTHVSPASLDAALRSAGGATAAVDAVLSRQADNAFVAMRPPGHHAERETAMGFCLFGNVSIAAMRALEHHGLDRVAVLDFDVHHGNGTQDLLWNEKRAFFASSHQMPLYPGSGAPKERGSHGQILNVPLPAGSDGVTARQAWAGILQRVGLYKPQLIIVSAGFDAHQDDPLAQLNWNDADFAAITQAICDVATACHAPVVSCLEGGYDLDALGRSVRAHVNILVEAGK